MTGDENDKMLENDNWTRVKDPVSQDGIFLI
jgi:hypothetical protein